MCRLHGHRYAPCTSPSHAPCLPRRRHGGRPGADGQPRHGGADRPAHDGSALLQAGGARKRRECGRADCGPRRGRCDCHAGGQGQHGPEPSPPRQPRPRHKRRRPPDRHGCRMGIRDAAARRHSLSEGHGPRRHRGRGLDSTGRSCGRVRIEGPRRGHGLRPRCGRQQQPRQPRHRQPLLRLQPRGGGRTRTRLGRGPARSRGHGLREAFPWPRRRRPRLPPRPAAHPVRQQHARLGGTPALPAPHRRRCGRRHDRAPRGARAGQREWPAHLPVAARHRRSAHRLPRLRGARLHRRLDHGRCGGTRSTGHP